MAGRPPTPTALKQLSGTWRKDRDGGKPSAEPSLPRCPAHLPAAAKVEFKRVARLLLKLGVVTQLDVSTLASYAQSWARWVDAEAQIATDGLTLKTLRGTIRHPLLVVAKQAMEQMQAAADRLGLSPVARGRIKGTKPPETKDEYAEFRAETLRIAQ